VVHLRFGNLRASEFHTLLARVWPRIQLLLETHKLVNVYIDRIEGIG
jgi:predicted nuclease of predicted toxin-antitoxin system